MTHSQDYQREYYQANKTRINARNRVNYQLNKTHVLKRINAYYELNKKKVLEVKKNYRIKNKDKIKKYRYIYRADPVNKKKASITSAKYYQKNKRRIYLREKERRKNNPITKLTYILRSRTSMAIRKQYKTGSSLKLLGCSPKKALQYIENQFTPEMNWDNHGRYGWHIDHIKPVSSFNLSNLKQQKECFNYKNLQPLWWQENLQKSDKYGK